MGYRRRSAQVGTAGNFRFLSGTMGSFRTLSGILAIGMVWVGCSGESGVGQSDEEMRVFRDFDLSVESRWRGGEILGGYGVYFRKTVELSTAIGSGRQRSYWFLIRSDGRFAALADTNATTPDTILGWTEHQAIQTKGRNVLQVLGEGERFDLYINGVHVGAFSDDRLTEGAVGVVGDGRTKVDFTGFHVEAR